MLFLLVCVSCDAVFVDVCVVRVVCVLVWCVWVAQKRLLSGNFVKFIRDA
jgi:hypothetical protein